jgi:molybdopterin converting factor small subunit
MSPSVVRARFFARYEELLGMDSLEVPVDGPRSVEAFVREIRERGAPFDRLPADPAVAVNREVARPGTVVAPGDEVAFLPPVAGG